MKTKACRPDVQVQHTETKTCRPEEQLRTYFHFFATFVPQECSGFFFCFALQRCRFSFLCVTSAPQVLKFLFVCVFSFCVFVVCTSELQVFVFTLCALHLVSSGIGNKCCLYDHHIIAKKGASIQPHQFCNCFL